MCPVYNDIVFVISSIENLELVLGTAEPLTSQVYFMIFYCLVMTFELSMTANDLDVSSVWKLA